MIAERFSWTFEQIGELTFPQFFAICDFIGERPAPYTIPVSLKD